jgi:tRNA 2-thiouridine synthesizing protein A
MRAVTEELDLRGEVCPYTFVKTKLRLEELESGQDLIILLDDSAATANVSRSLRNEGHEILDLKAISSEVWQIVVKK